MRQRFPGFAGVFFFAFLHVTIESHENAILSYQGCLLPSWGNLRSYCITAIKFANRCHWLRATGQCFSQCFLWGFRSQQNVGKFCVFCQLHSGTRIGSGCSLCFGEVIPVYPNRTKNICIEVQFLLFSRLGGVS